jgi:hypothetical protein
MVTGCHHDLLRSGSQPGLPEVNLSIYWRPSELGLTSDALVTSSQDHRTGTDRKSTYWLPSDDSRRLLTVPASKHIIGPSSLSGLKGCALQ